LEISLAEFLESNSPLSLLDISIAYAELKSVSLLLGNSARLLFFVHFHENLVRYRVFAISKIISFAALASIVRAIIRSPFEHIKLISLVVFFFFLLALLKFKQSTAPFAESKNLYVNIS
jgi:hypothetical protein